MYRPAARTLLRASARPSLPQIASRAPRRFASTSASGSSSWRGFAVRLGLVAGAIYYYNTSAIFADEPAYAHFAPGQDQPPPKPVRTLETIASEKQARKAAAAASVAVAEPTAPVTDISNPEALEEEAQSEGAFNPETGEINWDCPCLGGMAYGPCGEEFKAAFSCFVYSEEDPKGMDCIEQFKGMQDCFRRYPEVYGAELEDEGGEGEDTPEAETEVIEKRLAKEASKETPVEPSPPSQMSPEEAKAEPSKRASAVTEQVKKEHEPLSEADEAVPKAWHDERDANPEKK